jgi:type II secretory pathway predicted ATPase ExeA
MYLEYYNLLEQPFGVTPDTRFLYLNHMYREALASLWYGVKENRGFMVLAAQPGMGKTTLLFQLLQRLRSCSARTVFLFQTCCNSLDLIRYLLQDLGIFPAPDLASMHQQLNDALVREARAGKQFVFVIDEAQNLSASVLEAIRLLSDFETPQGKLMQIILAGQPQLISTLIKPEMLQLRQRISVTTSLDPLGLEEVSQYVNHRLGVAGYQGAPLFTRGALQLIALRSRGIPRNINNLCFGALSAGLALRRKQIDCEIVEEVAADQNLSAIERRVTASPFENGSPECNTAFRSSASASRHRGQSPFLPSWFGRQVPRAAYVTLTLAVLMATASLSVLLRPALEARFLHNHAAATVSKAPATEISGAIQTLSVKTPPVVVQAAAVPRPMAKDGVVVVEAGQTLRQISLLYLGRYSTEIVQQIQSLNPQLLDPNRIERGQQIRLPVQWRGSTSKPSDHSREPGVIALRK